MAALVVARVQVDLHHGALERKHLSARLLPSDASRQRDEEEVELVVARRKAEGLGSATHIFTLRDHSIRDAFRSASKEASIPYGQQVEGGWTVHDLRRTYLTGLLQSGVDLATVRDLAGHHSITVTSRYVRSIPSSRRNAVIAAENLVRLASRLQVKRGKKGNGRAKQAAGKGNESQ